MATKDINALMLSAFVLWIKIFLSLSIQGSKRFKGGSRPPEDEKLMLVGKLAPGKKQTFVTDQIIDKDNKNHLEAVQADLRWQRIIQNDLENIPMGLIIAACSIAVGGNEYINCACLAVFTVCRIFHTVSYAFALQPHRAIFWFICVIASFGMGLNGALAAIAW